MDYCKMNQESGACLKLFPMRWIWKYSHFLDVSSSATVVYKTHQAALHARQKLHGFEYPIGESNYGEIFANEHTDFIIIF